MASTVMCNLDSGDTDEEFNNVEICVCESGNAANISNSQFSTIQSLLPEVYHHLICEFSLMKSNVEGSLLESDCDTSAEHQNQNLAGTESEDVSDRTVVSSEDQDLTTFNNIGLSDESRCAAISQIGSDLSNGICNAFKAKLRVNVNSYAELESWRMQFAERSKTTMRFANTSVCTGRKTLFKARLRCQHNTKPRSLTADTRKSSKNTRCPAFINLTLKRSEFCTTPEDDSHPQRGVKRCQSLDIHLPEYPLSVVIQFNHNHMLDSTSVLRRRDVSPEIESKFTALMRVGHHPVAALSLHKYDLYLLHGLKNYSTYASDRHHCPDLAWCYRIFYKLFKKKFRESINASIDIEKLTECVERCRHQLSSSTSVSASVLAAPAENGHISTPMEIDHNSQLLFGVDLGEDCIAIDVTEEQEVAVAICTPLMKRVHRLIPQSAEIVFVDTSPLLGKRRRSRTVIMMTSLCAGGLPLGVLVASSDSAIKRATQLFAGLLDSRCFFGRGRQLGPMLFVVGDCSAVQQALSSEFCSSSVLLSSHHILVGFWRLLWDRKSTIIMGHRARAFELLRSAMLASNMELLSARFAELCSDNLIATSSTSLAYIKNVQLRLNEWSVLCQAPDWSAASVVDSLGGVQGLCSCAARSLKDAVIHRLKSMETIPTVLDFVGTRMDTYFDHRLTAFANDQADDATALRFMPEDAATDDVVERNSHYNFTVSVSMPITFPSTQRDTDSNRNTAETIKQADSTFCVEMFIGLCSCELGSTGAPCRHQWSVLRHVSLCSWQLVQITCAAAKRLLMHIGSGRGVAESSWFAVSHPLQSIMAVNPYEGEVEHFVEENCIGADTAEAVLTSVLSDTPTNGCEMLNKQVLLTWNGNSYELNVQQNESPSVAVVLPVPTVVPSTVSLDRLRSALKKIEDAYVVHSVAMESAVNAFCQSVDEIDTVEQLNGALLGFTNSCSYFSSDSNGATTYNWA